MNKEISLKAYAKINLALDILGKRKDSYHELEMIMQSIDLYDNLTFKLLEKDEIVLDFNSNLGLKRYLEDKTLFNDDNLVYKAAKLIKEKYNIKKGVHIKLEKNIPIAAGLAGASTDAAATLKALNELFDLNLSKSEFDETALKLGADVPYCLLSKTALAKGIGEKLSPLKPLKGINIVLVKPNLDISTKVVFQSLKIDDTFQKNRPNIEKICEFIEKQDIKKLALEMKNVLESYTATKYVEVSKLKALLIENKAINSLMSGSGPSVFGIFENEDLAKACYEELNKDIYKDLIKHIYLTKMI